MTTLIGCQGKISSGDNQAESQQPPATESLQLELPEIPALLTSTEDRTVYLALHFWDSLDVPEDTRVLDTAFVEQNFSNFAAFLQYVPKDEIPVAIGNLVTKVTAREEAMRLLDFVARKYLDDPNSPMRNEEMYIVYLREYIENNAVPADIKAIATDRLALAMRNRPGTTAADFTMTTRDGDKTTLLSVARNDTTLVIFYDPECEHCKEITGHLADITPSIPYRIIAVNVEDNREAWDSGKQAFPEGWIVAMADVSLQDRELYHFPALPALYLLAPGGRVLLKDFPVMKP